MPEKDASTPTAVPEAEAGTSAKVAVLEEFKELTVGKSIGEISWSDLIYQGDIIESFSKKQLKSGDLGLVLKEDLEDEGEID